jgi:hypothetical protein
MFVSFQYEGQCDSAVQRLLSRISSAGKLCVLKIVPARLVNDDYFYELVSEGFQSRTSV